ncbi:MAG: hypothetical protein PUI60_06800, partial [Dialister sp.]|nr:hypothetical protein [Dialister sp.]MDY6116287.1 hypothetical protein [Dialister sp.]
SALSSPFLCIIASDLFWLFVIGYRLGTSDPPSLKGRLSGVALHTLLFKETLIQSQSRISYGFLYIASSLSSLNSSLFASDDSLLCIKIQE